MAQQHISRYRNFITASLVPAVTQEGWELAGATKWVVSYIPNLFFTVL